MIYLILSISWFFLGSITTIIIKKHLSNKLYEKSRKEVNTIYTDLIDSIYSDKTMFVNRTNNTVTIDANIKEQGNIHILYMMDRKDVAIFKGNKCLYVSELVDTEILDDLVIAIDTWYKDDIMNVFEIMGITLSKDDFEKKFNIKVDDIKNINFMKKDKPIPIEHNINDILDRINIVGVENLTLSEKEFLEKYSK